MTEQARTVRLAISVFHNMVISLDTGNKPLTEIAYGRPAIAAYPISPSESALHLNVVKG